MPRKNTFSAEANGALGYLLGVTLSDGSIWCHITKDYGNKQYRLQFDQADREIVEEVNRCLLWITGREYAITTLVRKGKESHRLMAFGNEFIQWILKETDMKARIPSWWNTTSPEFRCRLLGGLLDGDGWITQGTTKAGSHIWSVGLVTADPWLEQAVDVAASVGIRCYKRDKNRVSNSGRVVYGRRLRPYDLAASSVNFITKRKQKKLEALRERSESSQTTTLGTLASGVKIESGLHGDMQSVAEMTTPSAEIQ